MWCGLRDPFNNFCSQLQSSNVWRIISVFRFKCWAYFIVYKGLSKYKRRNLFCSAKLELFETWKKLLIYLYCHNRLLQSNLLYDCRLQHFILHSIRRKKKWCLPDRNLNTRLLILKYFGHDWGAYLHIESNNFKFNHTQYLF